MRPYIPGGRWMPAHRQTRIEDYEKRASKLESLVVGELRVHKVDSRSREWYGRKKINLTDISEYTNDKDREKLRSWLEENKGW